MSLEYNFLTNQQSLQPHAISYPSTLTTKVIGNWEVSFLSLIISTTSMLLRGFLSDVNHTRYDAIYSGLFRNLFLFFLKGNKWNNAIRMFSQIVVRRHLYKLGFKVRSYSFILVVITVK